MAPFHPDVNETPDGGRVPGGSGGGGVGGNRNAKIAIGLGLLAILIFWLLTR